MCYSASNEAEQKRPHMTALTKYARLEAAALWRASKDAQRVDVVICLGDATLTIKDMQDRALTHWSLAAIARANPGKRPAIFHPDGDPHETIEIAADEDDMIRALEKLRKAVERARPHKGRLRGLLTAAVIAAIGFAGYSILPNQIVAHALRVVPDVKRAEIGEALLDEIQRAAGLPCAAPHAQPPLISLTQRLADTSGAPTYLAVVRGGVSGAVHLPGGVILLSRSLVEDHESPDIIAGFIIAEQLRRDQLDPLRDLLENAGTLATLRLLTSGNVPVSAIRDHARLLLTRSDNQLATEDLLKRFSNLQIPTSPYAYALDMTGETTLDLIEGDPMRQSAPRPVLSDADWVRLQTICEG